MKNRFSIGVGFAVVLVLGGIVWLVLRPQELEPAYQGKPLRIWLKGFDAAQESPEYRAAQAAVQHIGTNALPALIDYLRRKDPPFHRQWINLKARFHWLHGEVDYAVFWHRRAAQACGALGPAAAAAFPALTEAMNDSGAAAQVVTALSQMMPQSVPVLTNIVATGHVAARGAAASLLVPAFSHPEVEVMARTALLNAMHDPDSVLRMAAAHALRFSKERWDLVVPALIAALNDPYPGVRVNAAASLGHFCSHPKEAAPDVIVKALTGALSDPHPSARGNAATSLGNFRSAAKAAVPELLKLLRDTSPYASGTVADRAAEVLRRIDPEAATRTGVK